MAKKKMTIYKRSLLGWTLILLLISIFCWAYVYLTMVEYEKSNINTYMDKLIKDIIKKPSAYFNIDSKYETENSIRNVLKSKKIDFKVVDNKSDDKYYLYIDNNKDKTYTQGEEFAIVTLDNSNKVKKLGMLNYNLWEVKEMEAVTSTAKIYALEKDKVTVNGITLDKKDLKETKMIPEYEEAYAYVNLPKVNYYEVDNLIVSPSVVSSGKNVELVDDIYRADTYFTTNNIDEAMKKLSNSYNPLEFAETWQMFLRAEYDMEKGRGLYRVSPNLIEGTKMYKKAKEWATNVDITFTSVHTLDKKPFTNEKISNITVYSDIAFSCDIYSEMNMTLSSGLRVNEKFNEKIYFVYYDNAYRVIAMKSIKE